MPDDSRIRVLLIDDDEEAYALTWAIAQGIPGSGFELEWVSTFEDGARELGLRRHDAYLIDYQLGAGSGIELVRKARADGNRAPMILLTGKGRYEVDVEAMAAGVSDYLDKSKLDPSLFERSIRYAVERTRSEAALRESEARHRSLFDHLPIGLYRTGTDGELLDANPALVSLLRHPDLARNFFVSPAHRQALLDRLDQFGVVRGFESELRLPDGGTIRVRTSARSQRRPDGTTLYVEGTVEDVSERHEAKEAQRRAAGFDWVFSASALPIVLLDVRGTILDANPAFSRLFGYEPAPIRGTDLTAIADPEDRAALSSMIAALAAGDDDRTDTQQRRFLAADGTTLWARASVGVVRNPKGHPDHLILLLEEVAEG